MRLPAFEIRESMCSFQLRHWSKVAPEYLNSVTRLINDPLRKIGKLSTLENFCDVPNNIASVLTALINRQLTLSQMFEISEFLVYCCHNGGYSWCREEQHCVVGIHQDAALCNCVWTAVVLILTLGEHQQT